MFKKIGIFSKRDDDRIEDTLRRLHHYLLNTDKAVYFDKTGAQYLGIQGYSTDEIIEQIDLAIVIGGDGTLLSAARDIFQHGIPILGVNLGRLGFLTDITPQRLTHQLDQIMAGDFTEDKRHLLRGQIYRGDDEIGGDTALNDIVIHVRMEVRMIEFTTHINGRFVNTQRADGIIISTPTGSTAYALSGGGPILHPDLEANVIVPLSPHTLSHRPIVVNADNTIELELCKDDRNPDARVSFDGQSNIEIQPGDRVIISPIKKHLRLIHPTSNDYYQILRTKLRWSLQP